MVIQSKLEILADAAKYDASCSSSGGKRKRQSGGMGNSEGAGICHSYTPDGRCVSLLKILLTNFCIYDCRYCVNRLSSPTRRARFTVEEVVTLTLDFYRRNFIEGLFLSSGVLKSPDDTMEELIEVARRLRVDHRFGGYIHLKAVAGAAPELLRTAGLYADRVSANIELPEQAHLDRLAPGKRHVEIEETMATVKAAVDERRDDKRAAPAAGERKRTLFLPAGQSTQMIVGASPNSDSDILQKASQLYRDYRLRRVYYSAYSPIVSSDAALPATSPPLQREHRLYQADWLLRFYGFGVDEIAAKDSGNLALDMDPKLAWALRNRGDFPVDVNRGAREKLLRVPGLGVKVVDRILRTRRHRRLRWEDLPKLGASLKRAQFFIEADGGALILPTRRLDELTLPEQVKRQDPAQLSLFASAGAAVTGQL